MTIFTWVIGLFITAWVGAMAFGALLRTKSAKIWFGDMLKQSPAMMTVNGIGLLITAALLLLNLIFPAQVSGNIAKLALVGVIVSQLSTLFMLIRGNTPGGAKVAPIVLLALVAVYWIILS